LYFGEFVGPGVWCLGRMWRSSGKCVVTVIGYRIYMQLILVYWN
jgi:hypothetical protein